MNDDSVAFEVATQQEVALAVGPDLEARHLLVARLPKGSTTFARVLDAWRQVTSRHDALRTTFAPAPGRNRPVQVVHRQGHVPLVEVPGPGRDADLENIVGEAWAAPFHAGAGPVGRGVFTVVDDQPTLVLVAAAAVLDLDSLRYLAEELRDTIEGRPVPADPLPYVDYAAWQGERRRQPAPAFWDDHDEAVRVPPLATDDSYRQPFCVRVPVPPGTGAGHEVGPSGAVDPEDVWLAMAAIVGDRLSGSGHPVIGLMMDARVDEELRGAVGAYTTLVPCPIAVGKGATFDKLVGDLSQWRKTARAAIEWAPTAHDWAPSYRPALTFEWRAVGSSDGISTLPPRSDLHLVATPGPTGPVVSLWIPSATPDAVAEAEQVGRMIATLYGNVLADPQVPPAAALLLSEDDRRWLEQVATGPSLAAAPEPVPRLFEAQARSTPDRIALRSDGIAVSYSELDRRANALAADLVAHGAVSTSPVGIALPRSIDQIIAILAVMKAGAGHLCLDLDHPTARLAAHLDHAGAELVVTAATVADQIPAGGARLVTVDRTAASLDPPDVDIQPDDLAYLVYTSGSTGRPKGVAITHRSLSNYALYMADLLPEGGTDGIGPVCGIVTSLSTDLANTSLYPALVSGGTVELVPAEVAVDPARFAEYCRRYRLDVLKITPTHLEALLTGGEGVLPSQLLVTGGEASSWDLAERVQSSGSCRLLNHYGPTETTVGSLVYHVGAGSVRHRLRPAVPIGTPIAGTTAVVVDQDLQPVPPGVPGELLVGGAGTARGYWRDEAQTAERFVPFRWAGGDPVRMYRTGDRVRRLSDGTIEFLGRIDGQIKVRGYRVETGEIEQALESRPDVVQAAVIQREDNPGDRRLVAYLVAVERPGPSASTLRQYLRDLLPEYMVPAAFVWLDRLPLGPSGKLDRAALPPPSAGGSDGHRPYVAPKTTTEAELAKIFAEILDVDEIGTADDFFELGGHSLLATQVIARARRRFELALPVHLLFTDPTVAGLARAIEERVESATQDEDEQLAQLLAEIDDLTDEEAEALLAAEAEDDGER